MMSYSSKLLQVEVVVNTGSASPSQYKCSLLKGNQDVNQKAILPTCAPAVIDKASEIKTEHCIIDII